MEKKRHRKETARRYIAIVAAAILIAVMIPVSAVALDMTTPGEPTPATASAGTASPQVSAASAVPSTAATLAPAKENTAGTTPSEPVHGEPVRGPQKVVIPMTVTLRNDGQIVPNGGTLNPDKDMNIRVDFSVPTDGSVKKGDYTEIALPKEMKFTDTAAIPIMMEVEGSARQVKLGEVTIDSADRSKATLTFGEEVENEEYLSIEGYFSAGISFDEQQVETSEDKIVVKIFDNGGKEEITAKLHCP